MPKGATMGVPRERGVGWIMTPNTIRQVKNPSCLGLARWAAPPCSGTTPRLLSQPPGPTDPSHLCVQDTAFPCPELPISQP